MRSLVFLPCLAAALAVPAAAQRTIDLPAEDRPVPGAFQELWSVGQLDGRDWETFADVRALAFDAHDRLYVLDAEAQRVLVFDADGRFVRQIGRKGNGPGELQVPIGLAVLADGTVVVNDVGRQAFSVFAPGGEFRENISYPPGRMSVSPIRPHPAGGVVALDRTFGLGPGEERDNTLRISRHPLRPGASPLPLAELEGPRPTDTSTRLEGGGVRMMVRNMPPVFSPTLRWTVLPDGRVAHTDRTPYEIRVEAAGDAPGLLLRRPIPPRKVTGDIIEQEKERRRRAAEEGRGGGEAITITMGGPGGGGAGGATRSMRMGAPNVDELEFAEAIPVVQTLTADAKGRIWVARAGTNPEQIEAIDVIAPTGRYLGTLRGVQLPAAFSASGRAAWIEADELGVERVVVRKLPDALN